MLEKEKSQFFVSKDRLFLQIRMDRFLGQRLENGGEPVR
jgi:hypothetical protein